MVLEKNSHLESHPADCAHVLTPPFPGTEDRIRGQGEFEHHDAHGRPARRGMTFEELAERKTYTDREMGSHTLTGPIFVRGPSREMCWRFALRNWCPRIAE
jgi:hypothetical protein